MNTPGSAQWDRLAALFDQLADLPDAQRASALAALADEDAGLARRLAAMLQADAGSEGPLEQPLADVVPELVDADQTLPGGSQPGEMIGRYRVLEWIGSGGMGEVWLAERADGAFDQQVAIKLLKRGMDSDAILRRFRQERSILARLSHPAIVRLLDGGLDDSGRSYFVMERVIGLPVTVFAAQRGLGLRARIGLVAAIADAVGHAHAQLVVHRDLKPANILVDEQGRPHVLDFGIAKALEDTGEQTLTGVGTRLLSPAYAAPEQILGEPVGTAADIYALGVLLFELITGNLPHKRSSRDPSVLASTLDQETGEKASHVLRAAEAERLDAVYGAATEPRLLAREVAGDLDVILGKALSPRPERRYSTAAAFADDLRRWLDRRPIMARADSARYRLAKFVRRHRLGVGAAVAVLVALLLGLGGALWQARIARQAAVRALAAEVDAQRQADIATAITEFLMRDVIQAANPYGGQLHIPLTDALVQAGGRLEQRFADNPALGAVVRRELASSLRLAGERDAAAEHVRRSVDVLRATVANDDPELQKARALLARFLFTEDEFAASRALYEEGIAAAGASPAPAEILPFQVGLAGLLAHEHRQDDAVRELERLEPVVRQHVGEFSPLHIDLLDHLMRALVELDRFEASRQVAERLRRGTEAQHGEGHPLTLKWLQREGIVLTELERFEEALAITRRACEGSLAALGAEHEATYDCQLRQGVILFKLGRHADAEALIEPAASYRERRFGLDASETWLGWIWLARTWQQLGRIDQAGVVFQRAADSAARVYGPDSVDAMPFRQTLGMFLEQTGQHAAAFALRRDLLAQSQRLLGEHIFTVKYAWDMAQTLASSGQDAALIAFCSEWLPRWQRDFPENDPRITDAETWLAVARTRRNDTD